MDITEALAAFDALSQRTRLETLRLLVRAGDEGLAAGDISRTLSVPHNTMSAHLNVLFAARLVSSRREGRSVIYSARYETVRGLLDYLMTDCCQGRREVVGDLILKSQTGRKKP